MHATHRSQHPSPTRVITALAARRAALAALAALLLLWSPPPRAESEFAQRVRLYLDERAAFPGGEVEISVGEPDPRLTLAPCARYEPFLPPGARLIGRTSLGVRCVEGA